MASVAHWITDYGYGAVFAGTLIEGESIAIMAGIAARHGYLALITTIGLAALGGMLGDLAMYAAGRRYGAALLSRLGRHRATADRISALVGRRPALAVIGVRFAYGLRIAGPIVIGASGMPPARFVCLNAIGALLWATLVVGVGYAVGELLQRFIAHHHHLGMWFATGVLGALVAWVTSHRLLRRVRLRSDRTSVAS